MKRKKIWILIAVIVLLALCFAAFFFLQSQPDGSTVESREEQLREMPKNLNWNIVSEVELEGYLISAVSTSTQDGIAIFEPKGEGRYQCYSVSYGPRGTIMVDHPLLGDTWYELFWLNQPDLDYLQLTYTIEDVRNDPIQIDAKDGRILYHESPDADSFSIDIVYYDIHGNLYE